MKRMSTRSKVLLFAMILADIVMAIGVMMEVFSGNTDLISLLPWMAPVVVMTILLAISVNWDAKRIRNQETL